VWPENAIAIHTCYSCDFDTIVQVFLLTCILTYQTFKTKYVLEQLQMHTQYTFVNVVSISAEGLCCFAEPVPMRMRALPQSMWQEPNIPHNVSPATVYPVLPPLVTREGDDITGS